MSKFLRIIEQSIPSEHTESKRVMVSKLVQLLDSLPGIDVGIVDHNTFTVDVNGSVITLDVRDMESINEAMYQPPGRTNPGASFNPTYSIDKEVEGQAAKAAYKGFGSSLLGITGPQQANQAVKKRQALVKKAVKVYDKVTKDLESAINYAASNQTKPTII
jgi:hypothetical protein